MYTTDIWVDSGGMMSTKSAPELPPAEANGGRRVEIKLDDDLYDRVRIKAMRQRKSLRALGAELFEAWAADEASSGKR
ncbi:MAG TPA: hypothetical protein VGT98_02755 [Candidatus Elarobacter sp.]|nr:hypothetical protein [Candidatus Elarobacter sp.]